MMSKNDFINALLELGFEKDPDYNSTYSKDGISIFLGDARIIGINFSVHDLKSHASDFETMIGYLKKLTNLSIIHKKEIKESEIYPEMDKELEAIDDSKIEKQEKIIDDFIELYSRGNTQLDFDQKAKLCNIIILKLIYDKL